MRRLLVSMSCLWVASVLSVAGGRQTPPQTPPAPGVPREVFRAGVDIVQLDVTVLDKNRHPVPGLTAADFKVLEDGKPRPIVAFTPVELPASVRDAASAAWVRDVAPDVATNVTASEGRLVVIVMDWSIRFEDQALARRIATTAINDLGPGDLGAVVFTSGFGNAGTPQNFTADHARLLEVINRPIAPAMHNDAVGAFRDSRNGNGVMLDDPEGYTSGDCYCRLCVPEAITHVADTVRDVQGRRKLLFFIGTFFQGYETLGPGRPTGRGGVAGAAPYPRSVGTCAGQLKTARENMVRAAGLANLTIHTLDPVGLETAGNSPMGGRTEWIRQRQDGLSLLADETGGRTVMNTNAPEELLPAIFEETRSYYLLGFSSADSKSSGKYHKVDVRVGRPGVTVRSRAGFNAGDVQSHRLGSSAVAAGTPAAMAGVLPRADVALTSAVAPFAVAGNEGATVVVITGIHPSSSAPIGTTKLIAAAFDAKGKSVARWDQSLGVTLPAGPAAQPPFEWLSRLDLKPGRYEVRVALDAGPDRQGSVYAFVEVPNFSKDELSASGVVLTSTPAPGAVPHDALADVLPIIPTARREFSPADRVTAFLRLYQAEHDPIAPVQVVTRIVDAQGHTVLDARADLEEGRFGPAHAADHRVDLPMSRLPPGEYLLSFEATKGKRTVRRDVRFTVR